MTLIAAWRDPFCMVSDDLGTPEFGEPASVGPKMRMLSESLVLGLAGSGDELDNVVAGVQRFLPAPNWRSLIDATDGVVDRINARIEAQHRDALNRMVNVVVAGTVGDLPVIFDSGPYAARGGEIWPDRQWAFAGSGGQHANIARVIASKFFGLQANRDHLLTTIVAVAIRTDSAHCRNPIWRFDLGGGAIEPAYKWLSVIPERTP